MRFFLIIISVLLLLSGFVTNCRKTKHQAARPQTAKHQITASIHQGNPSQTAQPDSNKTVEQQGSGPEPNAGDTKAVKSATQMSDKSNTDVNTFAVNRPTDANFKTVKPGIPPAVDANAGQSSHKSLISFQDNYAKVLSVFVDNRGMVNYKGLKRKRVELFGLLDELSRFDPNEYKVLSKEEQVAFWINAYNVKMLGIIVDNYPIESSRFLRMLWPPESVRHIDQKIGGIEKQKFIVMGEEFTLEELEGKIFCTQLDEPRAYFALTHTSLSSPLLRNEPYSGAKLNEQLNDQIKKYLAVSGNFQIDRDKQKVYLPAILQNSWYGKYFTIKYGTDRKFKDQPVEVAAVLNCIIKFVPSEDVTFLELKNYTVDFIRYDWLINEQ
jgi:hypothetical protein